MPTLHPPWQRFSERFRQLPPRRRQALTSASLICIALISLTLYTHYWGEPGYQARLQKAGLVDMPPQARASAGQAEADRAQSRALSAPPLPAPPPAPPVVAAPAAPPPAAVTHLQAPAAAPAARGFGWEYSAVYGDWRLHDGLDYAAPEGATVTAAGPGKVTAVDTDPQEGTSVTIDHPGGLQTHYAGLTHVSVKQGEAVAAGQALGRIGTPGLDEAASGPHLHFRVVRGGEALDPAQFLS